MTADQCNKPYTMLWERPVPDPVMPEVLRPRINEIDDRFVPPEDAVVEKIQVAGCWASASGRNSNRQGLYLHD